MNERQQQAGQDKVKLLQVPYRNSARVRAKKKR